MYLESLRSLSYAIHFDVQAAFNKFVGQSVSSSASSRTDTGVHALKNVCHVDVIRTSKRKPGEVLSPHDPEVVKRAVNHFLQKDAGDLVVVGVRCVAPDFHARFKAKERTYLYRIISVNGIASIFEKDRAWHVTENLNISAMRAACQVLVGHHDFSSFRAAGCQANSPMRTLDELHVCEVPLWPYLPSIGPNSFCEIKGSTSTIPIQDGKVTDEGWGSENENHHTRNVELGILINKKKDQSANRGSLLDGYTDKSSRCYVVTTRARSFLYHQVRLMVGTLKAVGSGSLTVRDVQEILDARSITKVPPMAPACGLYLADVKYDFDE
ncbi:hypothetical protein O6H91_Y369900 [Diphasiastrum complanatum]|nr:hypothetical protein O6H91_Y369900 [Diphasiastrum complanatum]